jgi:hypothetical protein
MYIQKEPSAFSSNNENKLYSIDFIISIIKETCLDIIKYLTEEFTINDLNILNSIKIAICTLQLLYYETYQNVQQRIIKQVIHEIQNNCFNFVKHYYSLLSDNILQSENLNQNNLKRYGKLMNNLVIINSSYFTNDIEKKYFSVIKDKSIEEIKNMNFLKCVFNLTNNYSNLINASNNYDCLLKIVFEKAIQEISVNKINLILVEVILKYIFCNNNIIYIYIYKIWKHIR